MLTWTSVRSLRGLTIGVLLLATAGMASCADDKEFPPLPPETVTDVDPAPAAMRRLLGRQYNSSIELIFGAEAASAATPPADSSLNGYQAIASAQQSVTDEIVRQYEESARAVAAAAMTNTARIDELVDCDPASDGDTACFDSFVANAGRLVFRRALSDDERADYVAVGETALEDLGTFDSGVEYIIVALLQSPSFVYQVEVGDPLGSPNDPRGLNAYELATRMSFFLVDRTPDEELLAAAEAGDLNDEAGIRAQAIRLLETSEARAAGTAFFMEYFSLTEMETLPKDPALFPEFSPEVAASMERETRELIADVLYRRNAPATELLTASYSFIDENLASIYDVPAPAEAWDNTTLPAEQGRSGVLSHASILSTHAHADSTSVTHRGIFVLERFLCSSMPPPPEDVVTELPPSSTAPTMRERVAVHLENEACAGCHRQSDPMGLALENFDPIGRYRAKENGELIDASGQHGWLGEFVGVAELSQALVDSERATQCMVRNVYRHATGHVETDGELVTLEELHAKFKAADFSWRELLLEMVAHPLFRTVGAPEEASE